MKILLLCNKSPWPPNDGGALATLNMISGLSAKKVSVTVLAMNTSRHFVKVEDIPDNYRRQAEFHFANLDTDINFISLFFNLIFSRKPYNLERFRSEEFEMELTQLLENKFDVIQLEGLALYHYLPAIRKKSLAKIVFRAHNVENLIWSQLMMESDNLFKKYYFRILAGRIQKVEKQFINKVDALVPICTDDLNWFKVNGLEKPSVVCVPGVITENLSLPSDAGSGKVFFIGALDWRPNITGLIWFIRNVWPLVLEKVPDATFSIAGRNASKQIIRKVRGKNVIFFGEVPSSQEFIKDKSIMAVPLFSGSGIRMKIIEGMSLGKSIVTTHTGAKGLDFEDKRNIFIADTSVAFANIILDLLKDAPLRIETGRRAIENVRKNYNILASTENLLKFYSELTA